MLAEIIHKVASQEYQEKGNSKYYPRPSLSGADRCIRQMVYWRLGIPATPLPGRSVLVFDDSNWHEELTDSWLRKTTYNLHSEQMKLEVAWEGYPFTLRGKIDGIIQDIEGKEYLFEHKAISHFTWQQMAKGEPSVDHLSQMSIYLRMLKGVSGIEDGILLLKNKNTAQYLEFLISYSIEDDTCLVKTMTTSIKGMEVTVLDKTYSGIVKACFDKFQAVEDYAVKGKAPARQYEKDHWRCEYCPYHETCWANYEDEFKVLGTKADLSEIEDLCAYYLETSMHVNEMKKEKDKLKAQIKEVLKRKEVREGTTEKYIVKNALIKSVKIDKDLIPANILPVCQKEGFMEKLSIRLKKGEVKKNER